MFARVRKSTIWFWCCWHHCATSYPSTACTRDFQHTRTASTVYQSPMKYTQDGGKHGRMLHIAISVPGQTSRAKECSLERYESFLWRLPKSIPSAETATWNVYHIQKVSHDHHTGSVAPCMSCAAECSQWCMRTPGLKLVASSKTTKCLEINTM